MCKKKKTDAKFACKKKRRHVLAHHDGEHEDDETHEETLASCCGNGCQSEEIKDEEVIPMQVFLMQKNSRGYFQ